VTLAAQQGAQAAPQRSLAQLCQQAIGLIERAKQEQPRQLSEDVDEAERAVVQLRDQLIELLRQTGMPGAPPGTHSALDSVNAVLSLIVGVEYPAAGLQRKLLEQAGTALNDLLKSGQLGDAT
jgi:hypothetical protein